MSSEVEILTASINFAAAVAPIIIPIFLEKSIKVSKRAEKIWEFLEPKVQKLIFEKITNFENLNDNDLVKYFNSIKILNESFLDLEADNFFKKKLLNKELNEILTKTDYKYVYNKITAKDLNTLNIIGKSWEHWCKIFDISISTQRLIFFPTYSLIDQTNTSLDDDKLKSGLVPTLALQHQSNLFKYNKSMNLILEKYNNLVDYIFNLVNLGLLIPQINDPYIPSGLDDVYSLHPFALSLTTKGKEIYETINYNEKDNTN